jgi:hypothetical protein
VAQGGRPVVAQVDGYGAQVGGRGGAQTRQSSVLIGLRQALDELGLLKEAKKLDLRSPVQDYFNPLFSTGWTLTQLDSTNASPNANKGSDANGCE